MFVPFSKPTWLLGLKTSLSPGLLMVVKVCNVGESYRNSGKRRFGKGKSVSGLWLKMQGLSLRFGFTIQGLGFEV